MNVKSIIAAAVLSTAAVSVQAGGLLPAQQTQAPTPPPPAMAAQPTGTLGGAIIPIALGVGLLGLALSGSDSGGGS